MCRTSIFTAPHINNCSRKTQPLRGFRHCSAIVAMLVKITKYFQSIFCITVPVLFLFEIFYCFVSVYPITSDISYIPASLFAKNFAASIAPFAKIALEYAVCLISITSSVPA